MYEAVGSWKVFWRTSRCVLNNLKFKSYRYPTQPCLRGKKWLSFCIPMMFLISPRCISWKFPKSENPPRDSTHHQPNFIVAGNLGERSIALDWWCCLKCRWSYRLGLAGRFKYLGFFDGGQTTVGLIGFPRAKGPGWRWREKSMQVIMGIYWQPHPKKSSNGAIGMYSIFFFPFAKWNMWGREVPELTWKHHWQAKIEDEVL